MFGGLGGEGAGESGTWLGQQNGGADSERNKQQGQVQVISIRSCRGRSYHMPVQRGGTGNGAAGSKGVCHVPNTLLLPMVRTEGEVM